MSTWPGLARRASTAGAVLALLVSVVVLGACGGSGGSTSSTGPRTSAPGIRGLPPPTVPAGGCSPAPAGATTTVTVTVNESGFSPRCVTLTAAQTLRLRNTGKVFHNVAVEDLNANLAAGDTQNWDEVGQYLAPGAYVLYSGTERNPAVYPTFHTTLIVTG